MKRDMELIKIIMLNIENDQPNLAIQGYEEKNILFHKKLLIDVRYTQPK